MALCLMAGAALGKELPRRHEEEPRKADQACAYLGEGFTRAPGSDTCVRVGGSMRFDAQRSWSK